MSRIIKVIVGAFTALLSALIVISNAETRRSDAGSEVVRAERLLQAEKPSLCRIVLVQDVTGSGKTSGTPRLRVSDVGALFDAVAPKGNVELAGGIIGANSGLLFERVSIEKKPVEPAAPSANMNPFEKRVAQERYAKAMAEHELAMAKWTNALEAKRTSFLNRVRPLLETAYENKTDAAGALNAATILFNEDVAFARTTSRYLIAVSDVEDNVGRKLVAMPRDVTVVVVNKTGRTGLLAPLHPVVLFDFEPVIELAKTWR